jgi:hypothetical protein
MAMYYFMQFRMLVLLVDCPSDVLYGLGNVWLPSQPGVDRYIRCLQKTHDDEVPSQHADQHSVDEQKHKTFCLLENALE